jgi:alpha-tubulin suppressor-like RCC1 family protein
MQRLLSYFLALFVVTTFGSILFVTKTYAAWDQCRTVGGRTSLAPGVLTSDIIPTTPISDTTQAFLLVDSSSDGQNTGGTEFAVSGHVLPSGDLRFERQGNIQTAEISYTIVECFANEFSVQAGEVVLSGVQTENSDATLSPVDQGQSIVLVNARSDEMLNTASHQLYATGELSADDTVMIKRAASGSTLYVRYQVVTFNDPQVSVRTGEVLFNSLPPYTEPVPVAPVDAERTWLYFTYDADYSGVQSTSVTGQLASDGSSVEFARYSNQYTNRIRYYLVEFPVDSGVFVRRGDGAFTSQGIDNAIYNINLPVCTVDKVFPFVSTSSSGSGSAMPRNRWTRYFRDTNVIEMENWQASVSTADMILEWQSIEFEKCTTLQATVSLTAGGKIIPAGDATTGDGGIWVVYKSTDSDDVATGAVGEYLPGYWAGEVGDRLTDPVFGDELISVIELSSGGGYYGVQDTVLNGHDPAEFPAVDLHIIPVPNVTVASGPQATLNWSPAPDALGNISGYHVHRSSDGVNFTQLTSTPVAGTSYVDSGFPCDTAYYAISLVYRGTPAFVGSVLSAKSSRLPDLDGDSLTDICDVCPNDPLDDVDGDGLCGDIDICPNDFDNDLDADGVCGDVDNCPAQFNTDQNDVDGDGAGDVCDVCPNDALNDLDGDGACGDVDNCPVAANADQLDTDSDGFGDACDALACVNPSISAGGDGRDGFTLGLSADGTVFGAGDSYFYSGATSWVDVVAFSAGGEHAVGLRSDGTVVGAGNGYAYSGTSTWTNIVEVSAGPLHTVGLKSDGTVVATGDSSCYSGVQTWTAIKAIATGAFFTLGLKDDGTVVAAGQSYTYSGVETWTDIIAIAGGGSDRDDGFAVGLKNDGTVVGAGPSYFYSGVGTLNDIIAVSADVVDGFGVVLGLKSDGTVVGVGNPNNYVGISAWTDIVAIDTGSVREDGFNVGLMSDGRVVAAGDNRSFTGVSNWALGLYQQDSDGDGILDPCDPCPLDPDNDSDGDGICGNEDNCPALSNADQSDIDCDGLGDICDGSDDSPSCDDGNDCTSDYYDPLSCSCANDPESEGLACDDLDAGTINDACNVVSVCVGELSSDIDEDGVADSVDNCPTVSNAEQVDSNENGIGDACETVPVVISSDPVDGASAVPTNGAITATFSETMDPVSLATGGFTLSGLVGAATVDAGSFHNSVLREDGTVVAWAYNGNGQTDVPGGLSGVIDLDAGGYHTVVLRDDGTVTAWGYNGTGQTVSPGGLTGVVAVAAGDNHTLALKDDGTVVAWGSDAAGQVTVPGGLGGVIDIAAGGLHSVALKDDGTVVSWGGDTVPGDLTGVMAISSGGSHTLALKDDGTVVGWGDDTSGQSTVPAGLTGVTAVAAGFSHSVALKDDGTVVAWGLDDHGQSTVPAGLNGVTHISAGYWHSIALQDDGTVVVWGDNTYGQENVPVISSVGVLPSTVSYDAESFTATLTPSQLMIDGESYTASVMTTSALGVPMASAYTWSFTATMMADADNDGVPDASDNCLSVANPAQRDADTDGAGDACAAISTTYFSSYDGTLTINGFNVETGDEVAVYDPDGVLCGHYVVDTAGQYGTLTVYGDNPATAGVDEGAVAGDPLTFKIWDASAGVELRAKPTVVSGSVMWSDLASSVVDLEAVSSVTTVQSLKTGWNLVSIPVAKVWYSGTTPTVSVPGDVAMEPVASIGDVFSSIDGMYTLIRSFDADGYHTYNPSALPFLNTLKYVAGGYGYWVNASEPIDLVLTGPPMIETDSLSLKAGWNLIGYWGDDVRYVDAEPNYAYPGGAVYSLVPSLGNVLGSLGANVDLVRSYDSTGYHTYNPSALPFLNTMKYMGPGYSYWLKLNADATLHFGQ